MGPAARLCGQEKDGQGELLVESANSQPTAHPKIFKAIESGPPTVVVSAALVRLRKALDRNDLPTVYRLLEELVEGYAAPAEVNDVLLC